MSDDWRAAIAQERVVVAENVRTAQNAQIDRGQAADSDRRDATTLLQALQSQQAIVAGQAAIANADSETAIAISDNETLLLVTDKIIQASQPDYSPLYVIVAMMLAGVLVWPVVSGRRAAQATTEAQAPAPQSPRVVYQSRHACAWQQPDGTIILRRLSDGCERVYVPGDEFYQRLLTGGK